MTNTNDKRAAFQDFRDQRNKELAANGLDDQSNFWITNAHYTAWCRGIEWQTQQAQGEAVADGIEAAAAWVDARAYAYVEEHGSYDPDTGTTEFAGDGADYLLELEEIAEGIRSLAPPAPAAVPEGWKLVPVEPTLGMLAALAWAGDEDLALGHAEINREIIRNYGAMLTASPAPGHIADVRKMVAALRQYRHNDGGGFVFAYDKEQTDRIVTGLVKALEPFAACADELDGYPADGVEPSDDNEWASFRLLVSDYRRARTALAAYRKGGE